MLNVKVIELTGNLIKIKIGDSNEILHLDYIYSRNIGV